jgi:hypothetical protein
VSAEIDDIVAADRSASREIDGVRESLAGRVQAERDRLAREQAEALAAAERQVEAEASRLEREGRARIETRRAARAGARAAVAARTAAAVPHAIEAYVAILKTGERNAP